MQITVVYVYSVTVQSGLSYRGIDMTRYAVPDNDASPGDWAPSTGSDLFEMINEAPAAVDGDYISVTDDMAGAKEVTFRLTDVPTPDTGTRTVLVRASEDGGMDSITLTVTLKEGGVSKGSQAFSSGFGSVADLTFNITSSISDYSDLTLVISSEDGMGGTSTTIYQAHFLVPEPAAATASPRALKNLIYYY